MEPRPSEQRPPPRDRRWGGGRQGGPAVPRSGLQGSGEQRRATPPRRVPRLPSLRSAATRRRGGVQLMGGKGGGRRWRKLESFLLLSQDMQAASPPRLLPSDVPATTRRVAAAAAASLARRAAPSWSTCNDRWEGRLYRGQPLHPDCHQGSSPSSPDRAAVSCRPRQSRLRHRQPAHGRGIGGRRRAVRRGSAWVMGKQQEETMRSLAWRASKSAMWTASFSATLSSGDGGRRGAEERSGGRVHGVTKGGRSICCPAHERAPSSASVALSCPPTPPLP